MAGAVSAHPPAWPHLDERCDMSKRRALHERLCSIEKCGRPHEARSYCQMHYRRWKLYGDPLGRAQRLFDLRCVAEGCERVRRSGAWCLLHYQRVRRHGDQDAVRYFTSIPTGGCVVDGCDRPPMHSSGMCEAHYKRHRTYGNLTDGINAGRCDSNGYRILTGLRGHPFAGTSGTTLEHRFVMATLLNRPLLREENVHHSNGDRADNRPENLELWSSSQPQGQRVADKVRWALELLALYRPDELRSDHLGEQSESQVGERHAG